MAEIDHHMTPSSDELQDFLRSYNKDGRKPSSRKVPSYLLIEGHSDRYIPETAQLTTAHLSVLKHQT